MSALSHTRSRAVAALRPRARSAYLATRRVLGERLIDGPRRIDTSRIATLEELDVAGADRVRYEPSGWLDLRRILRRGEVGPEDVFLDMGSGKGRMVLEAARYPFGRVIGVELSAHLDAVARANLEASRERLRCPNVELVVADALDYEIPDDVTVVYMYNPFRGELFEAVVAKLLGSVDRAPRPVRLIYRTPLEEEQLLAFGRFRLIRTASGLRPGRSWSRKMSIRMYSIEAAGAQGG